MITIQIEPETLTAEQLANLFVALLAVQYNTRRNGGSRETLLARDALQQAGIANCGEAEWNRLVEEAAR